jgi:diguanylate cyclase (GGDEF)-like protein
MTQKARWRTAHIAASILGAILLALTARHVLVINSPDLRTGALATTSMAAMMVGLILLVRFLSARHSPTLYLALGFLGSGILLGVHVVVASLLVRDNAPWSPQLAEASDMLSDGVISVSFLASWAAWRWQKALDRRLPAIAQVVIVAAMAALAGYLAFTLSSQPAFSKTADLLFVAVFAVGLIGISLKNAARADTHERWLILAGIFLVDGQVAAGLLGDGAGSGQVGAAELMTVAGYFAAFVGSVMSTFELFQRAERAMQVARGRNDELQREVVVRKQAEEESRQLALIDPLTNIYNRRGFTALAGYVREIARRQQRPIHILLIDLDRFKRINDTFGHAVGDKALAEFGQILTATFRKSDVVARTGGDEFCVLLVEPDEGIQTALARLRQNVEDSNDAGTHEYRLEFSVGIARAMPGDDASIHALVEMADEAMYEEKRLREGAA